MVVSWALYCEVPEKQNCLKIYQKFPVNKRKGLPK